MKSSRWTEKIQQHRRSLVRGAAAGGVVLVVSMVRTSERQRRLETLPLARYANADALLQNDGGSSSRNNNRTVPDMICALTRTSLQGTSLPGAKSVKEELEHIRKWHHRHGYNGGIVLRELTKPLFRLYSMTDEDVAAEEDAEQVPMFDITDPMRLARRECYYLYYELTDTGQLRQEIFCRGTTLYVDILTCLQTWWVYDEDLQCRVHCGFRDHADRMLNDILPLLAPPTWKRATVEITGHSLGGAVAQILAIKLQKRGYNVVRVTSVASPRYCAPDAVDTLLPLLPKDTLCIDDDRDVVPLLPPFGAPIGNRLWLIHNGPARFIPAKERSSISWPDSFWWNFRFWDLLLTLGRPHRIRNHVAQLKQMQE